MLKNLYIALLFLFCANLSAQEQIRYTTKQGLPSNHIYDIQEDADGFMWFATNRGLVKYDGETFKTFTIQDGLPNNDTWLLELDYQGRLWYFSKSNYQGYIKNDSIYKFPVIDNKVISPRYVHKSKERLWMHSSSGIQTVINDTIKGIGIFSQQDWLKSYDKVKAATNNYDSYSIMDIHIIDLKANEYAVLKKDRIFFLDNYFKLIKKINVELPKNHRNFTIDNRGFLYNQIYYYAMDRGVLFIDFKTKSTKYFSFKELVNVESAKYFRCKGLANEIQVSIPGHLLIFNYDLESKETHSFEEKLGRTSHQDSNGNIWLADFANGVSLLPNTQVKTNYYLKNKKVQKINKIDSVFYAGINDVGFYKYNSTLNAFKSFLKFDGSNGEIYQIKKDNLDNILFISSANSFIKKKRTTKQLVLKNRLPHFSNTTFKNIIQFKKNIYSISGSYVHKNDKNFNFSKVLISKEGLISSTIFKDKLYFGGTDGLHIKEKDTLIRPKTNNNLTQVSISNFLATKDSLYVGTDGRGVYSYNENKVIHLKNTDGFSIQKIIKKENELWLATEKGVHKVSLNLNDLENSKIINSFYESDGLLQNNINDIYIERDTLYAATDVGLSKLNINNSIYKQEPKLFFKTKNYTLSYVNEERDNISLTFALQNYNNQDYVTYQYRLLPIQTAWTTTSTKTINFSNLSPDVYQLEVKATDQHFNQSVATQYIDVQPTWWQTTLARIGFVLLALFCFWLLIRSIKKQVRKNESEKALQDRRIAGLELQALRSQMNPHFVHNSLNAIQYYIQRNEVELSENYLSKFSQLIRLFFEYSRQQTITIKEEIELLTNYLDIEKLRFEEKLEYQITVCDKIDVDEQLIPSMLLQPMVENAVNHGLFHKKENGTVFIEFKQIKKDTFKVIVKDDGIGINKAKVIFKASSKNYQSNSSAVLQERLELLNKGKEWEISYKIEDISEINKNATGTIVTLVLTQNQSK